MSDSCANPNLYPVLSFNYTKTLSDNTTKNHTFNISADMAETFEFGNNSINEFDNG